ncbi:MAG: hypothetical protein M1825_001598 [Sarcosagium campestre]|nr:MAG: hypothetical protein M1825_001598 [Sarcosagium campestre]
MRIYSQDLTVLLLSLAIGANASPVLQPRPRQEPSNTLPHRRPSSAGSAETLPSSSTSPSPSPTSASNGTSSAEFACGPVEQFFYPTPEKWQASNTGPWLDTWWTQNSPRFAQRKGFSSLFGASFLGNPGWTCQDDGSVDNCDLDPCDQPKLNNAGKETEPAYYVLQSVRNLHSYFLGLKDSFQVGGIFASLQKDDWAYTYYKDKNDVDMGATNQLFSGLLSAVGVVASFAAPFGPSTNLLVGSASAIFAGAISATRLQVTKVSGNDTPVKGADMGAKLAQIFLKATTNLITANNALMNGEKYGDADIREYIKDGKFVESGDVDATATIARANTLLASTAINYLWKQQKIFIMGGGPCDDSAGVGSGPQEAKLCRDGKAWYLFYWREYGGIQFGKKHWGNVDIPPGLTDLNAEGITIQDIIGASVDAYKIAGLDYSPDMHLNRTQQALSDASIAPNVGGPSWEGTFTIPVCDITPILNIDGKNFPKKDVILQPYGAKKVPQWCAPICAGPNGSADFETTQRWVEAAQMKNFQSFQAYCPKGEWL